MVQQNPCDRSLMEEHLTSMQSSSPIPLVASMEVGDTSVAVAASAVLAVAVAWLAWSVLQLTTSERTTELEYFERIRRRRLRDESWTYRYFEPLIEQFATWRVAGRGSANGHLARELDLSDEELPWEPREYLALKTVEGGLVGCLIGLSSTLIVGVIPGLVTFVTCIVLFRFMGTARVKDKAMRRVRMMKRRLPYAIDLMALIMEAGGSFQDSLRSIVEENRNHPIGEEFHSVLSEMDLGRTRREALEKLRDRINDEDINEIVFSIIKGEELGTPLAEIFRTQAEQMRLKRSQWAEKAAGQAQVQIVFPGMLVMLACLLVIATPFVLKAVNLL